jgi:hypothetical protein
MWLRVASLQSRARFGRVNAFAASSVYDRRRFLLGHRETSGTPVRHSDWCPWRGGMTLALCSHCSARRVAALIEGWLTPVIVNFLTIR